MNPLYIENVSRQQCLCPIHNPCMPPMDHDPLYNIVILKMYDPIGVGHNLLP